MATKDNLRRTTTARSFPITERYLSDRDMAAIYGVSRATIWRWAKQGHIPAPIRIAGSTRWRGADVVPAK